MRVGDFTLGILDIPLRMPRHPRKNCSSYLFFAGVLRNIFVVDVFRSMCVFVSCLVDGLSLRSLVASSALPITARNLQSLVGTVTDWDSNHV